MNVRRGTLERWTWPAIIVASALVAGLMVYTGAASPLRYISVVWFITVCPGMAFVRLLSLRSVVVEWTLGVALSFALTSLVAMVMLYAGWWRPEQGFTVLVALAVVGAALSAAPRDRRSGSTAYTGRSGETSPVEDMAA